MTVEYEVVVYAATILTKMYPNGVVIKLVDGKPRIGSLDKESSDRIVLSDSGTIVEIPVTPQPLERLT